MTRPMSAEKIVTKMIGHDVGEKNYSCKTLYFSFRATHYSNNEINKIIDLP